MKNYEINTTFNYVTQNFSGLMYDIAGHLESLGFMILPSSEQQDKYQFRVSHQALGCIASIFIAHDTVLIYDSFTQVEHVIKSYDEFVSKFIESRNKEYLGENLQKCSNAVNVSIEKSNDAVKSLVKLIQFLILSKGLSMRVSRISLDYDMLLRFENDNNTKSFVICADKVVDGFGHRIKDEIDIYLYLQLK